MVVSRRGTRQSTLMSEMRWAARLRGSAVKDYLRRYLRFPLQLLARSRGVR